MQEITNTEILDDFLDLIKESSTPKIEFKQKQQKELDLWHDWHKGGRKPVLMKPLYESFKPLIENKARHWKRSELPTSIINAEYRKQFVNAIKTYNPDRGTQLNTWVQTNLMKASRYFKTYQNPAKMPEKHSGLVRAFKEGKNELSLKLGYEPDTKSLSDHLGWPHRRVMQMEKELSRRTLPTYQFTQKDPAEILAPKELEAVNLMQYDTRLGPDDRLIYEYTFGMGGRPRLKPGEIATKTGLHPSKISRVRNKLKDILTEITQTI